MTHRWAWYYDSYQRPMQQSDWATMEYPSMVQSCHPIFQWGQNLHHFQKKERFEGCRPRIYLKYRHPIHRWCNFVESFSIQMDFIWIWYIISTGKVWNEKITLTVFLLKLTTRFGLFFRWLHNDVRVASVWNQTENQILIQNQTG